MKQFNFVSHVFLYFQDQYDNVGQHTEKGIYFCEKFTHFLKERCTIEQEYARSLK